MEITEHIDDLVEGYALNALDQGERDQVEQHIAICPPCRQLVVKLEEAVHLLGFAAVAAAPSITCKRRVLERIEREQFLATPTRRSRIPGWAISAWATVATVALVVMSVVAMSSRQQATATFGELSATRAEMDAIRAETGTLRAQISERSTVDDLVVNGAERRLTATGTLPKARAVCLMKPGFKEAILVLTGLAPLPAGKTYQAWVAKGDEQAPLAVFTPAPDASTVLVRIEPPKPMDYYDDVMVTVEDDPGAQQPSEETVLLGEL